MENYLEFAELLNKHLKKADRPAAWLATRLGVSRATVARWCNGETQPKDRDQVIRICDCLSIPSEQRKELMVAVVATIKQKAVADDADAARIISMLQVFIEDKQSYTQRALVALELIQGSDLFNSSGYERLSKSVMFFASVTSKAGLKTSIPSGAICLSLYFVTSAAGLCSIGISEPFFIFKSKVLEGAAI